MIRLTVNGIPHSFDGDPEMPLLWYLRDVLKLAGTKFGCGMSLCGACTVHVNGKATRSCVTAVQKVTDKNIITIEGLERMVFIRYRRRGCTSMCLSVDTARAGK